MVHGQANAMSLNFLRCGNGAGWGYDGRQRGPTQLYREDTTAGPVQIIAERQQIVDYSVGNLLCSVGQK